MTLQNLVKIGLLHEHRTSPTEIDRLLTCAERNLADAGVEQISAESRFDAAYKCIMQLSLIATIEYERQQSGLAPLPQVAAKAAPTAGILPARTKLRR